MLKMTRGWANSYFLKTCGLMLSCLINAFHNCRQDSGEPWDLASVRGRHASKDGNDHFVSLHDNETTFNVTIDKVLYGHPTLELDLAPVHTANSQSELYAEFVGAPRDGVRSPTLDIEAQQALVDEFHHNPGPQ